jgi:hypothetical protein
LQSLQGKNSNKQQVLLGYGYAIKAIRKVSCYCRKRCTAVALHLLRKHEACSTYNKGHELGSAPSAKLALRWEEQGQQLGMLFQAEVISAVPFEALAGSTRRSAALLLMLPGGCSCLKRCSAVLQETQDATTMLQSAATELQHAAKCMAVQGAHVC